MADLSVTYMGLKLRNPVIIGSSKLAATSEGMRACEQAGAAAVVMKSLFEEQIMADTNRAMSGVSYLAHVEARDLFAGMGRNYFMSEYLSTIESAKKVLSIPVIASVNCVSAGAWLEYARGLESAGADALELNTFLLPANPRDSGRDLEQLYLDIARKVKSTVRIPVAMKIGYHFSGMAWMLKELGDTGLDALVLFNRFYRPDFDIDKLTLEMASVFSAPEEIALPLQWISLLAGKVRCDLAASTGAHDAPAVVKLLLAGANAVQLCTTLYRHGIGHLTRILEELQAWMKRRSFNAVSDFRGLLSQERSHQPESYERSQYIQALVGFS